MAGLAALTGLRQREVGGGDRVLVIGASGGIGSFAVQLAKASGAHVTGVCSTRNIDAVRGLGANAVVDYTMQRVSALEGPFDLIFDNVGATPMLALERMASPTGLVLPNSGENGPDGGALARVVKANWHGRVRRKRLASFYSAPTRDNLELLGGMLANGTITPLVDTMFTLDHAADAMARVASRHARGKVVVSVRS
jgi:NADPH:quinone reductase-like Zn-dependent oxidoreductase